jgi:opacity protein-like surface antigen
MINLGTDFKRFFMKKILGICLVILLVQTEVFSQTEDLFQQKALFGFKAGLNLGKLQTISNDFNSSISKSGFYIGSFIEFVQTEKFSMQPEINYSSTPYQVDDKVGYLHVPFLAKYKIVDNISLYAGPELQFLLSISNTDIKEKRYKKFILGVDVGADIEISENFLLEGRYNLGLSKFDDIGIHTHKKFHFFQIGLAYKFQN